MTIPPSDRLQALIKNNGFSRISASLHKMAFEGIEILPLSAELGKVRGASKTGGVPHLPASLSWPTHNGQPLTFISQINLTELQISAPDLRLPKSGVLLFFYDLKSWGDAPKDQGAAQVLYSSEEGPSLSPRSWWDAGARPPRGEEAPRTFKECFLDFRKSLTLPHPELVQDVVGLSEPEFPSYVDLYGQAGGYFRMLGHPYQIQGDMERQCQIICKGLRSDSEVSVVDARKSRRKRQTEDWILLLQVPSDQPTLGMTWGDGGAIYYWIRKKDLELRDFSRCWLFLQTG